MVCIIGIFSSLECSCNKNNNNNYGKEGFNYSCDEVMSVLKMNEETFLCAWNALVCRVNCFKCFVSLSSGIPSHTCHKAIYSSTQLTIIIIRPSVFLEKQ